MNISISFGGLDSEKKPTVRCRKVFLKCSSTSWLHERTRRNEPCVVQKCFRNILISLLASYMDIAATTGGVTSPDQPITLAIISSSLYWVHGGLFTPSTFASSPRHLKRVCPDLYQLAPKSFGSFLTTERIHLLPKSCFDQPAISQRTKTNFETTCKFLAVFTNARLKHE